MDLRREYKTFNGGRSSRVAEEGRASKSSVPLRFMPVGIAGGTGRYEAALKT